MTMHKPLLLLSLAFAVPAYGHDWYPSSCCLGSADGLRGDCAPIPATSVKPVKGGFEITLTPGQHPKVKEPQRFFIAYEDAKPSQDGDYHACLWPSQEILRCFFSPLHGV